MTLQIRLTAQPFSTTRMGSVSALLQRPSSFLPFTRRFATLENKVHCDCGAPLLEAERIISLFKERNLRQVASEIRCSYLKKFEFKQASNCSLVDQIQEVATPLLRQFQDVVHIGNKRLVLLEALHQIPKDGLGDLTGDHGKQLVQFLKKCMEKNYISKIGACLDVGGQNTSTVRLISKWVDQPTLPSLIIDVNSICPALSKLEENVKYVIEDGYSFFNSPAYKEQTKDFLTDAPTLFVFNNLLNVLHPQDGWDMVSAAWARMRKGDYLVISGLTPEHLKNLGFVKHQELSGIVEYSHSNQLYKSGLGNDFSKFVERRLKGASVLMEETFKFSIQAKHRMEMGISGRRLLTIKKEGAQKEGC